MRQRDAAICIRTTDYSETSQVVHFLTRTAGAVRLIAKGSKRAKSKTGGAIDLLAEGDLVYTAKSSDALGTLIEFSESVSHRPLRADAVRLNTALYMIELAGELIPLGDPHPESFDLLHNALARLAQPDAPLPAVLAYYQWRLLRQAGLLGDLSACVACGQPAAAASGRREAWFSSRLGGLLCRDCEPAAGDKHRLDGAALAGLAALAAAESGRKVALPDAQATAVNRLLGYHVREQLGKPLRMARHVIG